MEATSWNLHHGSYIMELTPRKLPSGPYTMEVPSWNVHQGNFLMEHAPWKLLHGT